MTHSVKYTIYAPALAMLLIVLIATTSISAPYQRVGAQSLNQAGDCGPMDIAFAIDTSTSMGGALANVKSELVSVLNDIEQASRFNYRLALVNFADGIDVQVEFSQNNRQEFTEKFTALALLGGLNEPEASDEALNTIINKLSKDGRPQNEDFTTSFRPGALNSIVLVTDARPGGFKDSYIPGVDDVNAHQRAIEAAQKRITISAVFVPTPIFPSVHPTARTIMQDYAATTDGLYIETNSNGVGTSDAIKQSIAKCGLGVLDTDGDGLPDEWEINGIPGAPIHEMGADPLVKDIFVQVNWMEGQRPDSDAIKIVVNAFKNAPTEDGKGIRLHVDMGPDSIDYVTGKRWREYGEEYAKGHEIPRVEVLGRNKPLAQAVTSMINDDPQMQSPRVFHYGIFIHKFVREDNGRTDSSGISFNSALSTTPRQTFLVSLGGRVNGVGSIGDQAGTFMHELGHSLALQHGGADEIDFKPNYLSVMNYHFQFDGLIKNGVEGTYDYSRFELETLDENALNEDKGIEPDIPPNPYGTYGTKYKSSYLFPCPPVCVYRNITLMNINGRIDWNYDSKFSSSEILRSDINGDGQFTRLTSQNDWKSLSFRTGVIGLGLSVEIPPYVITDEDVQSAPQELSTEVVDGRVVNTVFLPLLSGGKPGGNEAQPTIIPTPPPPTKTPTTPPAEPTATPVSTRVPTATSMPTSTPTTPTRTPTPTVGSTVRIEAGGSSSYADTFGNTWTADANFVGGSTVDRGNVGITGTNDPRLYQTERWGLSGYVIPVTNGTYTVRLHFAETSPGITQPGQRVFGLSVEGTSLGNIDIVAQAGGQYRALVKAVNVTVTDGQLNIGFTKLTQNTAINAIEVIPTRQTALRIQAGTAASYLDDAGVVWVADTGFVGGNTVDRGNVSIANTANPRLYQTERWNMSEYVLPLTNGRYEVRLHFAETSPGITQPGQRVFGVTVEGSSLDNIDVFAESGGQRRALVKTVTVDVTDGQLNINFTRQVENPMVNAIEIIPVE